LHYNKTTGLVKGFESNLTFLRAVRHLAHYAPFTFTFCFTQYSFHSGERLKLLLVFLGNLCLLFASDKKVR